MNHFFHVLRRNATRWAVFALVLTAVSATSFACLNDKKMIEQHQGKLDEEDE